MTTVAKEKRSALRLAWRFSESAWMAPALSFLILIAGDITRRAGFFPAPYYIGHIWLASVAVHAAVAISLLVRRKFGRGLASVGLLGIPCACFWLVSQQ
jgi:hypothetical protein